MQDWSTELCDCSNDCCWCLAAYCAPCVVAGVNADEMGKNSFLWCIAYTCGFPIFGGIFRGMIRKEYSIEGNFCSDCMVHWCCFPCALRQEYTEIQKQRGQLEMDRLLDDPELKI